MNTESEESVAVILIGHEDMEERRNSAPSTESREPVLVTSTGRGDMPSTGRQNPALITEAEENVRYIMAGAPTGWAAIDQTLGKVDEDKVNDYKEDIDTLLVFTGLFSAVLTAFVLVSYPMPSPDPQDTTNQYLAQISAQTNSYTIAATTINSTIPPDSLPPFKPTLAALRINYLWFASLIICLVTASFSMLVKQWLRQYLAFEFPSPQARFRVRRFRRPGLTIWKVFEIAGFLPLLLQLALALFFLGLCFFTRSEDHGIGDMCAALVALWASFLVTATMAPAFSSQCPYKTPFLKPVMDTLRRYNFLHAMYQNLRGPSASNPVQEENDIVKPSQDADKDELLILTEVDKSLMDDEFLGTAILDALTKSNLRPIDMVKFALRALELRIAHTVDDDKSTRKDDIKRGVLRAVEPRRRPTAGSAILDHPSSPEDRFTSPPDLRPISGQGRIAISEIVAAAVQSEPFTTAEPSTAVPPLTTAQPSVVQDAMYLLLSNIVHRSSSPRVIRPLLRCIQKSTISCVARALVVVESTYVENAKPTTINHFRVLLDTIMYRLHELLKLPQSDVDPSTVIDFVLELLPTATHRPLKPTSKLGSVNDPVWSFTSDLLGGTIHHLLETDWKEPDIGPWLEDAIHILLSPLSYPLTPTGSKALAGLYISGELYQRTGRCVQPLASPKNDNYGNVLRCLGRVCQDIADEASASWFLTNIVYSIPCTKRCTHTGDSLGPVLAEHAFDHIEWTQRFSSILIERIDASLEDNGWPPGALASLWALMSLPPIPGLEIPQAVSTLILDRKTSATVLRSLVSTDPEQRSWIVPKPAINCIKSLVERADTAGRLKFLYAIWDACDDYSYESKRNSEENEEIGSINPIRHLSLASKIHASPELLSDSNLFLDWGDYYTACAEAMHIFRSEKWPAVHAEEREETLHLAGECLDALDHLEPAPEDLDQWDEHTTVFPDVIFQELVEFVADADAAARISWRIRRLRKNGVIPGGEIPSVEAHEPASGAEAAVDDSSEDLESSVADEGGEGPAAADSESDAMSKPSVSPTREIDEVAGILQDFGGEKPATEVSDGGEIHPGSTSPDPLTPTTQEGTALMGEDRAHTEAPTSNAADVYRETASGLVLPHSTHEIQGSGGAVSSGAQEYAEIEGPSGDGRGSSTSSDPLGSSAR